MMNDGSGFLAIALIALGVFFLVGLAIHALICWLLSGWLAKVPREHRKQEPGMVWLLMIPLFNLVWNFFVFPRIADSFESYFRSKGDGVDTGKNLAMIWCIALPCSMFTGFIPCVGPLVSLGVLVVLVLVLVKFHGLKERLVTGGAAPPPAPAAPPPPPPPAAA